MTSGKVWKVYCHTNKVNGKKYIGITSERFLRHRFHRGEGYRSCKVFYRAIKKYGWDAFRSEVLRDNLTMWQALSLEHDYVKKFRTTDPRYGYNMVDGGHAPRPISEEGRNALRVAATGANNPGARAVVVFDLTGKRVNEFPCKADAERFYGFKLNHRHIAEQRGTCHGYIFRHKDDVGDTEQLPPEQVYQRCEQKLVRDDKSWHSTPVSVFDAKTGELVKSFSCAKHANEFLGANCSSNLRGKSKSVMGYVCKYSSDVVGSTRLPPSELPTYAIPGKSVCQYDLDGKYIQTFPNAMIAEAETGINRKQISNCVRGKSRVGGGYLWRLESDDTPLRKPMTAYESSVSHGIPNGTSVDQIDLNTGEVVATYLSMGQAAKAVGARRSSISIVVNHVGNSKSCKGYGWRKHDESN